MDTGNTALTFEFALSESQQIRASRSIMLRQRETRWAVVFFGLVAAVAAAHMALQVIRGADIGWWNFAPLAAAPAGWYLLLHWTPRAQVRQLREGNRATEGSYRYTLNDQGLEVSALGARASVDWENVAEGVETREFILLFVSKSFAHVLPKAAVAPGQLDALRDALARWLPGRFEAQ